MVTKDSVLKSIRQLTEECKSLKFKKDTFSERQPDWKSYANSKDIKSAEGKIYRAIRSQLVTISGCICFIVCLQTDALEGIWKPEECAIFCFKVVIFKQP